MTEREQIKEDDLPSGRGDEASQASRMPAQATPHQAFEHTELPGSAAKRLFAQPRERAVERLGTLAEGLRATGHQLQRQDQAPAARFAERAAARVAQLSDYLRAADLRSLRGDAARLARSDPLLFLGGAFVVGLLGARLLRSSRGSSGRPSFSTSAPTPSYISDEAAARLLREAEQAYRTVVSPRQGQPERRAQGPRPS